MGEADVPGLEGGDTGRQAVDPFKRAFREPA
jgi:hypothetical protein